MVDDGVRRLIAEIQARRGQLRMTQQAFSEVSGISLATINNLENGRTTPTVTTLGAIDKALGWKAGTAQGIRFGTLATADGAATSDSYWRAGYDQGYAEGWQAAMAQVRRRLRELAKDLD